MKRSAQPHKLHERVTIRWPGGPYDFVLEYLSAEPLRMAGWENWVTIYGLVVKPDGPQHRMRRGFVVRPVEGGGYEMLPKRG